MKVEVNFNLDEFMVNDYGDTVASIIREEIHTQVRAHVRKAVKEQLTKEDKRIKALISKVKFASIDEIEAVFKNMRKEVGK